MSKTYSKRVIFFFHEAVLSENVNKSLSVAQLLQSLLLFAGAYIRKEKFGGDSLLIKLNCFHLFFECVCACAHVLIPQCLWSLENSRGS